MDLRWNPLKYNWLLLRILSDGQKVFYIKKEESSLSDLSQNVRKPFQQMNLIILLFILEIYTQLRWHMLLCSKFCKFGKLFKELFKKKREKREEHHFNFFIELLLEHVNVNETGAFGIPPDKVVGVNILHILFLLQPWHVKLLMLNC